MTDNQFIACGWYTPDYEQWLDPLCQQLDERGIPHDFVKADKRSGGWEVNTLAKAVHTLAAMNRHPDKTILLLDVDCQVVGSSDDITTRLIDIGGDVGFFARIKLRRSGKPVFSPRSGTMVFRPTTRARDLAEAWVSASEAASRYAVDQDTLTTAIGRVPYLSITVFGIDACAAPNDKVASPVILHNIASEGTRTGAIKKITRQLLSW